MKRMIELQINDLTFLIEESQLHFLLMAAVPTFMHSSSVPAPDPFADLMRTTIKTAASFSLGFGKPTVFKMIMREAYGDNAPDPPKREDKLPYIWGALASWVTGQVKRKKVVLHAEKCEDKVDTFYIRQIVTESLHAQPETTDSRGEECQQCQ